MKALLAVIGLGLCLVGCATLYPKDLKSLKALAEKGDAGAQDRLGHRYSTGNGAPRDFKEAVKWYRKAAEQGVAGAQYNLGVRYFEGIGVPKDFKEAVKWYRKAAEQGMAKAQHSLGVTYRDGLGVEKDAKEAVELFRKAAEQGDDSAQLLLGDAYGGGEGVEKDVVIGFAWISIAAANGSSIAQDHKPRNAKFLTIDQIAKAEALAKEMTAKNPNLLNDPGGIFAETKAKAEARDAGAQFNLGVMYDEGKGVPQDDKEAVRWYRKAADQGHVKAQWYLGGKYRMGIGVPMDVVTAYAWYQFAATNGDQLSRILKAQNAEKMTRDQIAKAEALVKEMTAKNPKLIRKKD